MRRTRRQVCASSVAVVFGTGIVSGDVSARSRTAAGSGPVASAARRSANSQSTAAVSGRLVSASGDAVGNNIVKLTGRQSGEIVTTTTDSNGAFQAEVAGNAEYILAYIQSSDAAVVPDRPDDLPSHLLVRFLDVGDGPEDLGTIELPQAHRVEARVLDAADRPVQGAKVEIRSEGFGLPPGTFTTNEDGYVKHSGADRHGVDLAGPVQIGVWPPGESKEGRPPALKRVLVDQERSLTLTLQGVDGGASTQSPAGTTPAQGAGSSGDGAGGSQRGFFSNSGNEPDFLSNVFSLTMLGFLMSAAGLIYQMMEGR